MHYVMGDLQGCCDALNRLLSKIDFSPSRDHLTVLGDLVNRGPDSLGTLRRLRELESSASCLLGNHDLHLLAVAHGVRKPGKSDTLDAVLHGNERDAWVAWLRERPLARYEDTWLMVHAGVAPQWTLSQTLSLAGEVQACLRGADLGAFLRVMYGNAPTRWDDTLGGDDRLRFTVNALTRLRFVSADGALALDSTSNPQHAPPELVPWFDAPGRRTLGVPIAFGHWSALGLVQRDDLLALDTGCVWGGRLSVARIDAGSRPEIIQVACEQQHGPQ